jgi:hypothetical protein
MNDRPGFATNIFDEYQEDPEPIRSHEEILKHNWFWLRVGAVIFLVGVLVIIILSMFPVPTNFHELLASIFSYLRF